jgi:dolichol kinase
MAMCNSLSLYPCPGQVVGVLGLFFFPIPLLMKQIYLIWVGIIIAFIFTYIPEWTAWVLLVLMAVYDLIAVLTPHGPLKVNTYWGEKGLSLKSAVGVKRLLSIAERTTALPS